MAKRTTVESESSGEEYTSQEQPVSENPKSTSQNGPARQANGKGANAEDLPESDFEDEEGHDEFARTQMGSLPEKVSGEAAQSGVIKSIEYAQEYAEYANSNRVLDFMCHKKLTINLGRQINVCSLLSYTLFTEKFIVGHNGSGKSAFLTALTIALGGKASATGRGSGLKDLVRSAEGVTKAVIILKLHNEGPDAFKPKEYGSVITITRTIHREGSGGGYKMSSASGETIATTRPELQAICDHFGIQVENPINILTQDAARQFLSASSATEKYQLFLKGTLLSQLVEDYDKLEHATGELSKTIEGQSHALKTLGREAAEAKTRWTEAEAAATAAQDLEDMKKRLTWAYVIESEKKIEKGLADVAKVEAEKNAADKLAFAANEHVEACQAVVAQLQADAGGEAPDRENDLDFELRQVKADSQVKSNAIKRIRNHEFSQINTAWTDAQARVAQYKKVLADEEAKDDGQANLAQQRALQQLQTWKDEQAGLIEAAKRAKLTADEARTRLQSHVPALDRAKAEVETARSELGNAETNLGRATAAATDSNAAFGQRTGQLLQAIQRERGWQRTPPIGPIGKFVKVKDKDWATVTECVLNRVLNGYIVACAPDRQRLLGLMRQCGAQSTVYVATPDPTFTVQGREPADNHLTILRNLTFENDLVRKVLIDTAKIEGSVLVQDTREADDVFRAPNVGTVYTYTGQSVTVAHGGRQTRGVPEYKGPSRLTEDRSEYIRRCQEAFESAQQRVTTATTAKTDLEREASQSNRELQTLQATWNSYRPKINALTPKIGALQDKIDQEQPAQIGHLREQVRVSEENVATLSEQARVIAARLETLARENGPLVRRADELQALIDERNEERRNKLSKVTAEQPKLDQAERILAKRRKEADNCALQLAGRQAALDKLSNSHDQLEENAKVMWAEPDLDLVTQSSAQYSKLITAKEKALKEAERRQGMTVDEIKMNFNKTLAALKKAKTSVGGLKQLYQSLKRLHQERVDRWHKFLVQISVRARMQFIKNLSVRNYAGKIKFNHDEKKLSIQVQTDEAAGSFQKDARALSGGEKSFSTVAFLLTLWEAVGCPIRGLDEFDVFQDAVNRTISLQLLIEAAKRTDNKQHIFITPQNISNIASCNEVKIHRLNDPERDQGTLQLGNR